MLKRRRFQQITTTLEERLVEEAIQLRVRARKLPPGSQQESLLRQARDDETAAHISEWLTSPGLRPPT